MKTHIHLLAESTEGNLSEFMRRLLTAYTVWFHKRHQSHGHLFSGRFKSLVVERGDYMLALSRYIHLNPVDAGIARFPEDYPWSSMRAFLDRDKAPPFLFKDEILGWFDGDPTKYAEFVREGLSEDTKPGIMQQRYVGSKPFARRIAARMDALGRQDALLPEERMRKKEERRRTKEIHKAEKYLREACRLYDCNPNEFKNLRHKGKAFGKVMRLLCFLLRENTQWTFREIAEYLGHVPGYIQMVYKKATGLTDVKKEAMTVLAKVMGEEKL